MNSRAMALTAASALVLAACNPAPEEPAAAPEPAPVAPAPAETSVAAGEFNVVGTEPFWAIDIRADTLMMQRPDYQTITVPHSGGEVAGEAVTWSAGGISVTLTPGECSDGMSDRVYPYKAAATVDGEALAGCAAAPGADLGPPP